MAEDLEKWKKAGRIAAEALEYGRGLIKKNASLLGVTEKTEQKILDLGGKPAFPVQIALNHVAAHFCPDSDDKTLLTDQVVKLDVGVHVDGCIGDTACAVDLSGNYSDLIKASQQALNEAIKSISPSITLGEIGQVIQDAITAYNLAPVRNLGGHGLEPFNVHSSPNIPNFNNGDTTRLEAGQIVAIEPFASAGAGVVLETGNATVFSLAERKPVRDSTARKILDEIDGYEGLPFTKRWLTKKFPLFRVNMALKQMTNLGILHEYPPLVDKEKGLISQAEHTIFVTDSGAEVFTKA